MNPIGSASPYQTSRSINSNRAGSDLAYTRTSDARGSDGDGVNTVPQNSGLKQAGSAAPSSTFTVNLQGQTVTFTWDAVGTAADLKVINVPELPEDQYKFYIRQTRQIIEANTLYLQRMYTDRSSPMAFPVGRTPATQPYATVVVGGRVVATIDNQGVVGSDNDLGERLRNSLSGETNGTNGPDVAQARADRIAEMLGGRVVKADTAITQSTFNALPPIEDQRPKVDDVAMKTDPLYQQLQSVYAKLEQTIKSRKEYLASRTGGVLFDA